MRSRITHGARYVGLVGETFDDVRSVMIEGPSGILATHPRQDRPRWLPSRRLIEWENGAQARIFAADSPDQLRGPEFEYVWADEIGKWRYEEAWQNLMLALRIGAHPQVLATTTPRPKKWLKNLMEADGCVCVTGRTAENRAHLSAGFEAHLRRQLGSPHLVSQELDGQFILEPEGGMWRYDRLSQLVEPPPRRAEFRQLVIGIDPAVGGDDETGIIVAGRHKDGLIWVLQDASCADEPHIWAKSVLRLAEKWRADALIAEVNQGGNLVQHLLERQINSSGQPGRRPPVRAARAMSSKSNRAAMLAAAYARDEIRHAAEFTELSSQMVSCVAGVRPVSSPDRLDALIWAVLALISGTQTSESEFRL